MAQDVSAAFLAIDNARDREPRTRMLGLLRNIVAKAEGSLASSSADYSTDFPAAGAHNGQVSHLNFGPAATADDGYGKAGWKSDTAGITTVKTTAAEWTAGTQTQVKTIGNSIELAFATPAYEQDFEGLTAASALAGQDSWVDGGGTQVINVETTHAYNSAKGVRLYATGGNFRNTYRPSTFGNTVVCSFRLKPITVGVGTLFQLQFYSNALGAGRQSVGIFGSADIVFCTGTTIANIPVVSRARLTLSAWHNIVVVLERSTPATTTMRIRIDGVQVHYGIVDTTGIDRLDLDIISGGGSATVEYALDNIRIGDSLYSSGTEEFVVDLGVVPVDTPATIALTGESNRCSVFGTMYSLLNNDANLPMRNVNGDPPRPWLGQTFTPAANEVISRITIEAAKVAAPVGNIWIEIRETSGGLPTAVILRRSRSLLVSALTTSALAYTFEFPDHFVADNTGTTVYAMVVMADSLATATDYINLRVDASAPAYAGGNVVSYDGATWTADATRDMGFICAYDLVDETRYAASNQDADLGLNDTTNVYLSQGFKLPYTYAGPLAVRLWGKAHGGGGTSSGRIWVEIQGDSSGSPDGTALATSIKYSPSTTWTAYRWVAFTFPEPPTLTVGTQYHIVVKSSYTAHATAHIDFGCDDSAATYADGQRGVYDGASWTMTSTSDMIFAVVGQFIPFARVDCAFSTDGITPGTYVAIAENSTRAGTISTTAFTGELKRYWHLRLQMVRTATNWPDVSWTPAIDDVTMVVTWTAEKWWAVDLTQAASNKTITAIELFGHPTEGGFRRLKIQTMADGGAYADLTTYDTTRIRSSRKGGGATLSYNVTTHELTTTGDYLYLPFTADLTIRYVKVIIYSNDDSYARIVEMRGFRVVDWTDRVATCSFNKDADIAYRRTRAARLSATLNNDDQALSRYVTGDYNDQLGSGVRLMLYAGYNETPTEELLIGIFYVRNWPNSPKRDTIQVMAYDAVALFERSVRPRYKQNKTLNELIEYLANLCNFSSACMIFDRTGNRVEHFAPTNPQAWSEMGKLAEAAAFSQLSMLETGELELRVVGNTGHGVGIQNAVSGATAVFGPGQQIGNTVYYAVKNSSGLTLVGYDLNTGATATIGSAFSGLRASLHLFNNELFILVWNNWLLDTTLESAGELRKWVTSNNTFPVLCKFTSETEAGESLITDGLHGIPFFGPRTVTIPPLSTRVATAWFPAQRMEGSRLYIGGSTWEALVGTREVKFGWIDFMNYEFGRLPPPTAITGTENISGLTYESGEWWISTSKEVSGNTKFYVEKWEPYTNTCSGAILVDTGVFESIHIEGTGITGDGVGTLWVCGYNDRFTAGAAWPAYIYKIVVGTSTVTRILLSQNSTVRPELQPLLRDCVALLDDVIICGIEGANGSYGRRRVGIYDIKLAQGIGSDGQSSSICGFYLHSFRSYYYAGAYIFQGIQNGNSVIEVVMRKTSVRQETSQIVFTDTSGIISELETDEADGIPGASRIINLAVVKSSPLTEFPAELVWQAEDLPWGMDTGQQASYTIEFDDPVEVPASPGVTVVWSGGAAPTVTLEAHPTQPKITILANSVGVVTDLYIEASPLRPAASLVSIVTGEETSISRYGVQEESLDNEYINDPNTMTIIASWLVTRYGQFKELIKVCRTKAVVRLQLFDRVTITCDKLGINKDFYITSINVDRKNDTADWGLLEI